MADSRTEKNSFLLMTGLAVAFSFLVTLYAPLEIYFTNKYEFWFDLYGILGILLLAFLLLAFLIVSFLWLMDKLNKKLYRFFWVAGSLLFFDLWIEGSFLAGYLPVLDGKWVEWDQFAAHRIPSVILAVALAAGSAVLIRAAGYKKAERIIHAGVMGVMGMLLLTLVSLAVMNQGFEKKERMVINQDAEFEYSKDQNLIILILDAVDANVFKEVLAKHPEYYEQFQDFTYYDNMVSTYTQTDTCTAFIMTGGQWFDDSKESYEDYITRGYADSSFLNTLEEKNFRIGTYIMNFIPSKCERVYRFDNVVKAGAMAVDFWNFLKTECKMVSYRYAPFDLKRFFKVTTGEFAYSRKGLEKEGVYLDQNEVFYSDLEKKEISYTDQKMFKLIHIEGAHVPFHHDQNVQVIDEGTYEMSIEASFKIAAEWIKKLKEAGVYDNSSLIIMSDHGFSKEDIPEDRLHPVFLVKGIREKKEKMQISKAPVSFEDLSSAFDRLIDGKDGDNIFDWKESDVRDRRCYFLAYPKLYRYIECRQKGYAGDLDTLEIVNEEYVDWRKLLEK